MSDIDDLDFSDRMPQSLDSDSLTFSVEPPGTPPPTSAPANIRTLQDRMERKHRRSVSEQIFSVHNPVGTTSKGHFRGRMKRQPNTLEKNVPGAGEPEFDSESIRGGSLRGVYDSGWDYGNRSGPPATAHFSDFSPFDRSGETSNQPQSNGGRATTSGAHFKQAFKRVRKALNSNRTEDEGIAESSLNSSSIMANDNRRRFKRHSGERRRYQRRGSNGNEFSENQNRIEELSTGDVSASIQGGSDGETGENLRKQSRVRVSLVDLFSRVKRTMSVPSLNEDYSQVLWQCTLRLRCAKLKEKVNVCVQILYMDKFIAKSSFSGETNNPRWNESFTFPITSTDGTLELQIIEKHTIRSDKLIGRAYVALRLDETSTTHEATIKYHSIRKGSSQALGIITIDTMVKSTLLNLLDKCELTESQGESELPDEITSPTISMTGSYTKRVHLHKNLVRKLADHVHRHRISRSRRREKAQSSIETFYEPSVRADGTFCFSPYSITRRYLEAEAASPTPTLSWKPFFDWPGNRCLELPMMAIQRQQPARFWELRIPCLPWPIEFLLPMTRLSFPSSNLVDSLGVGDTVRMTRIVERGIINIYLVGARGLRSIPQVEMVPGMGLDDRVGTSQSTLGVPGDGSMLGGSGIGSASMLERQSTLDSPNRSPLSAASPETRAASLVALHWAAKSLTLQPSPQVEFVYGVEKRISTMVKNNSNPDFLEEFEFTITNGSPSCIRIVVYDRETQQGTGGIARSPVMGETIIDLTEMPLELTQKMELQLLKNSNEARILVFVTITGLTTTRRSPLQTRDQFRYEQSSASAFSTSRSMLSLRSLEMDDTKDEITDRASDKSQRPNLPVNYLKLVAEHFSAKNSFKNFQDIGWMRLKICSAVGLGGKSTNGRSEIYCVVDILNTHLRTQNVEKTKNPVWDRCFVIPLSEIHAIMKITVIEVDKNKLEVIGGLAIHPLRADNGGSKWYALKTRDLRGPTKGSILLEINVYFNQFKSAIKSFTPMEPRYRNIAMKQKESHMHTWKLLLQRFEHVKPLIEVFRWWGRVLDDWWLWKNPIHSILGLIGYQLLVYYFKPYFIPLGMVVLLLKNRLYSQDGLDNIINGLKNSKKVAQLASPQEHAIYKHQCEVLGQYMAGTRVFDSMISGGEEGGDMELFNFNEMENDFDASKSLTGAPNIDELDFFNLYNPNLPEFPNNPSPEEEDKTQTPFKSESKKSMRTRYIGIKENLTRIYDIIESTTSFYERLEGLFNWRIPWVSSLAVIVLLILTITMFFIPLKYLFMAWGLNKFTKAILRPNSIRHNEIMDFLSRVPNLIEAIELTEYRPDAFTIQPKGKRT